MANQNLKPHWKKKIEAWKNSGLFQKEFCRKSGISHHQFSYWRKKLLREDEIEQNPFLPVKTSSQFSIFLGDVKISFDQEPAIHLHNPKLEQGILQPLERKENILKVAYGFPNKLGFQFSLWDYQQHLICWHPPYPKPFALGS